MAEAAEMHALGVGFADGPYPTQALTIPERDETGAVIGITFREEGGRKGTPKGSRRGVVRSMQETAPDPVLIVEGPSDVLAGVTLHVATIGPPADHRGGDSRLIPILRVPMLADSIRRHLRRKADTTLATRWSPSRGRPYQRSRTFASTSGRFRWTWKMASDAPLPDST